MHEEEDGEERDDMWAPPIGEREREREGVADEVGPRVSEGERESRHERAVREEKGNGRRDSAQSQNPDF